MEKVVVPFIDRKRMELKLDATHLALVIFIVSRDRLQQISTSYWGNITYGMC